MTDPPSPRATDPLAVVADHLDAFNRRDLDDVLAGFAEDAVFATADHLVVGQRALRALFTEFFATPVSARLEVRSSVVQADTVACELVERIDLGGTMQEFAVAAFYTVRGDELVRVKVYREGAS